METQYSCCWCSINTTDFPVVKLHVDELSSARNWQHMLCVTLSANVNISNRLPINLYYRICTVRHIRIEIIQESQNVFWVLTWVGRILVNLLLSTKPMLKLKTHSGFHDLFLNKPYQCLKYWEGVIRRV